MKKVLRYRSTWITNDHSGVIRVWCENSDLPQLNLQPLKADEFSAVMQLLSTNNAYIDPSSKQIAAGN